MCRTHRSQGNPPSDPERDEIRYLSSPRYVPMVPAPDEPRPDRRWLGESGSMGLEEVYFGCLVGPLLVIMMIVAGVLLVDWLF